MTGAQMLQHIEKKLIESGDPLITQRDKDPTGKGKHKKSEFMVTVHSSVAHNLLKLLFQIFLPNAPKDEDQIERKYWIDVNTPLANYNLERLVCFQTAFFCSSVVIMLHSDGGGIQKEKCAIQGSFTR
jgi:hypothetical protein